MMPHNWNRWDNSSDELAAILTVEEWRDVPGWEGLYQVSDHGRVRSVDRVVPTSKGKSQRWPGVMLQQQVNKKRQPLDEKGYHSVTMSRMGKSRSFEVHKLVARAFLGCPPDPSMEVCHNDGNSLNNRTDNLRWDTRRNNILDSVRHGTNVNASKTHCKSGHELTEGNVRRVGNARICRTCRRAANKAYRQRLRGAAA